MNELRIDDKFKNLIPPLRAEEYRDLEQSIKAEGCRDALVIWDGTIIDGHNRYEICQKHKINYKTKTIEFADQATAKLWIMRNQLARRNLTDFARAELVLRLKPEIAAEAKKRQVESGGAVVQKSAKPPVHTRDELASLAGVSHDTIAKVEKIVKEADEETKSKLRNGDKTINRVHKDLKTDKKKKEWEEKREIAAAKITKIHESILVGTFQERAKEIEDGSISLILTDPPYSMKKETDILSLVYFVDVKLCDGGSFLCYIGQTQLELFMTIFHDYYTSTKPESSLRYWWALACYHSDGEKAGKQTMREYGIQNIWKPILWYVKGSRMNDQIFLDDMVTGKKEKDKHEWQQNKDQAKYFIEKLCPKTGIVLDPFLGSGTVAVAAKELNRKWIGIEREEKTAKVASGRVNE